ncbi:MAG TPA: hypothetical protein VGH10_02640 [Actinomycetota bacterium]|jgi:hypothetical protein
MRAETDVRVDEGDSRHSVAVLGAVRDDIRQTLRVAWIDPSIEAVAAASPVFFTAAWSAIRPNVGRSFLRLSRALRSLAAESVRASMDPPDLRKSLERRVSQEEIRRLGEAARAGQASAAKVLIVVTALLRAARREPTAGTGQEEPSLRRGIPDWQRWMSIEQEAERSRPVLERAARRLGSPEAPGALRLFARWPEALAPLWKGMEPNLQSDAWTASSTKLRRTVRAGLASLPHPIDLQWPALYERGLTDADRRRLAELVASHERASPSHTLAAAFAWLSFGAPEVGLES